MSDGITQYVRCYIEPQKREKRDKRRIQNTDHIPLTAEGKAIKDIGRPHEGYCIVVDTETTTDPSQSLRLGTYAVYGIPPEMRVMNYRMYKDGLLDQDTLRDMFSEICERGVFYDPDTLSFSDVETVKEYASKHKLQCLTRDEFIERFYQWAYREQALVIGHNLPFDLSRLATQWGPASGPYAGGFWLKLCKCIYPDCYKHPAIRVKHMGRHKDRVAFRHQSIRGKYRSHKRAYEGKFLDTGTLAKALAGVSNLTLNNLCAVLGVEEQSTKLEALPHGEAITEEYLEYAVRDVEATWEVYRKLGDLYRQHSLSASIWKIYSEASVAKAYLRELGVPRFMEQNPDFPKERLGQAMTAYYGGRSEVRIRLEPTEVIVCDFKSQYPTVNALMDLQELLLADRVTAQDCTNRIREWLQTLRLGDLQTRQTWKNLRVFVKVRPDGDLLPVRVEYGAEGHNIGDNYVTSDPVWYALADVVASAIRTGHVPEILEAWELVPEGQVETRKIALLGEEEHTIDLSAQDLFVEVINLRTRVRAKMKNLPKDSERHRYLDGLQWALKVLANSGSYGVLVEINQGERTAKSKPVTLYGLDTREVRTELEERPGPYFAGPLGALITAGGRLLLAIAERLAADRGMGHAFCDTDSMAFARPEGMGREEFAARVDEIREWFRKRSPYEGKPDLFEVEDANEWEGRLEPLYFIGVSAKRYVLYNRLPDRTFRIRKFSSHGAGLYGRVEGYSSPPDVPEPHADVHKLGGHRWLYDLWYRATRSVESGNTRHYVDSPALDIPARHRVTCSTHHLLRTYGDIPGLRPYSFFEVLPALEQSHLLGRESRSRQDPANYDLYPLAEDLRFRVLPDGTLVSVYGR